MIPLIAVIGSEFMPPLYEGSLLYMPTAPPGMSITEATRLLQLQDQVLSRFPEVERVFGTVGRGTTATDNSPMGMVNTTLMLKPREQWRKGMTVEKLQAEMDDALQVPGFPNTWTQPIRNRLDMLFTGVKTPVGIKVLGPDLAVIERLGLQIESALAKVPGTRSVYAERVTQGFFTDIEVDRAAIARYGVTVEDVQMVIETAIGGETVTRTVEGRERYPVSVRYARDFRDSLQSIGAVLVPTPSGNVPLAELARISIRKGPAMIRDENGLLAGYVYVDTASKDLGGYVKAAQAAVRDRVTLPQGYRLDWTGQYEFQVRARERLQLLVPVVFACILLLLYLTFHSLSEAIIVMLSVVYAMTGGVIAQWLLGYNFSVAVWVGYIALYGIAVQTGVVMVVYLHEALDRRLALGPVTPHDIWEATVAGSVLRLAAQADDCGGDDALAAADHVEHERGIGRDEADRRADHRRHGDVDHSRADRDAGHLLRDEAGGAEARHAARVAGCRRSRGSTAVLQCCSAAVLQCCGAAVAAVAVLNTTNSGLL